MSALHPNDKLYALERALKLAIKHGEDRKVIEDLRVLVDEARQEARA
jgi:hypothetical protein